jgi:hypothetical protein
MEAVSLNVQIKLIQLKKTKHVEYVIIIAKNAKHQEIMIV